MKSKSKKVNIAKRKSDHISLAAESRNLARIDYEHFNYEPLLNPIGDLGDPLSISKMNFGPWSWKLPLWVSSMTGGSKEAKLINVRLAKATKIFGLGMGLGSCRPLWQEFEQSSFKNFKSSKVVKDFCLRQILGDRPFFANLGIAQIEQIILSKQVFKLVEFLKFLEVDGLCIHVNPLQEWLQPEGDRWHRSPLLIIKNLIEDLPSESKIKLIIKEVGQGMGPQSIKALSKLPIFAVEFGALGGTNFAWIEWKRSQYKTSESNVLGEVAHWGHNAADMCRNIYELQLGGQWNQPIIISGGIREFTPYFNWLKKFNQLNVPSLLGLGQPLMAKAIEGEASLVQYLEDVSSLYAIHTKMIHS